jgi:hypothetical protein
MRKKFKKAQVKAPIKGEEIAHRGESICRFPKTAEALINK